MEPASGAAISDPSDFDGTPLAPLAEIDSLLRCQICKDFYTNAVITSCFHTFCSLCIRRCLAVDGRCPTCRTSEQESKLRRNVAVQEVVDAFARARGSVLDVARQAAAAKTTGERIAKRKRPHDEDVARRPAPVARTRSQRKKAGQPQSNDGHAALGVGQAGAIVVDDSDQDYVPTSSLEYDDNEVAAHAPDADPDRDAEPSDGLVPCPICTTRMKPEAVFSHLDTCDGQKRTQQPTPPQPQASFLQPQRQPTQDSKPPPERLPRLNYSLLKEAALRKKLQELGIPNWGTKPLLIRRHTEWINLWNANCDSSRPRSRKELLAELDGWEKSQGGYARNMTDAGGSTATGGAVVMKKDFDGQGWARKNKDDFDELIAQARKARTKKSENTSKQSDETVSHPPGPTEETAQEGETNHPHTPNEPEEPDASRAARKQKSHPSTPNAASPSQPASSPTSPNRRQLLYHRYQRNTASPVPGFTTTRDPNAPSRLAETRGRRQSAAESSSTGGANSPSTPAETEARRASAAELTTLAQPIPTLRKSSSSLPDRIFASLGAANIDADDDGSTSTGRSRQPSTSTIKTKPMFEVPGDPVLDTNMGGTR